MPVSQTVTFYYDIQCPWAYIASRRIEVITARVGAQIIWTPVLLGGIYEATKAPQGKAGSATDVMPGAKKAVNQKDFVRTLKRFDIPLKYHPKHPVRTVDSVRLLHATPPTHRAALTHALYQLYWVQNADITDRTLLLTTARRLKIPYTQPLDDSLFADTRHHASLRAATADAVRRGAPGVPSFWIPHGDAPDTGLLFWGQDRLHFVEASLAAMRVAADPMAWDTVPRIAEMYPRKATAAQAKAWAGRQRTLTYYYDFSSPWCYLAWTQMERVAREAGKGLKLELVPVLVGGLFREIGTPIVPREVMSEQRLAYGGKDLQYWSQFWRAVEKQAGANPADVDARVDINWPSIFPIRSLLPLRVAILDERVIETIYKAAWIDNVNISDPQILADLLTTHGFKGAELVRDAQENKDNVKERLIENNRRAIAQGACGVPTFQVDGGDVVWGQDRLNIVQDLLAGWNSNAPVAVIQARL